MLNHIRGYIKADDRKIIIHAKSTLLTTIADWKVKELLLNGFPQTFKGNLWVTGQIIIGTDLQNLPQWFNRAIKQIDEENDWKKFPYVALEAKSGLIKITPLS